MKENTLINSGKLELYVLGLLSEEETKEIGQMIEDFPKVKEEVSAIEEALLRYAMQHRKQPQNDEILQKTLEEIDRQSREKGNNQWWKQIASILVILSIVINCSLYFLWQQERTNRQALENTLEKVQQQIMLEE